MSEPGQSLEEFLFEAALAKSSAEDRAAFLDGVCRDNPALRARLDVLLEGHFRAEGFLNSSTQKIDEKPVPSPAAEDAASIFIGRYKLLEKVGEGGFGEVWMAEQKEPVKRRVALKIIKLGMDTRQVVARFEAERQALALMDHPNIAKVLDAGATETGRPYFVMELVRGVRITDYCDQNQLPTVQRLKLFIQVCRAIQHAHQKGIIHRDIKPSNILVTLHDGVPVPKVIDFGIAKATQMELTERTVFTQFHQFLGTPAYVSPEQAEMSGLDIDTRSDIYSLGVLLYELLTGTTPFDTQELIKAGLEGMRQIVREREPLRPSARLTRESAANPLGASAQAKSENRKSKISQDLDWIVMKCLEKDRARRYETANGLAGDVQRYLSNEPVTARSPGSLYRLQKTVRRNKAAFAAGSVVIIALILGLGLSTCLYLRERVARQQAETARLNEIKLRHQVEQMPVLFFIATKLKEQKRWPEAEATYRQALIQAEKLYGNEHIEVVHVLCFLAFVLEQEGKLGEAEHCYGKALAISAKLLHAKDTSVAGMSRDGTFRLSVPSLLDALVGVLHSEGKTNEVEKSYIEYLSVLRAQLPADDYELTHAVVMLVVTLLDEGKFAEAEPLARECLTLRNKEIPDDWRAFNAQHLLGACLLGQKKYAEAEPLLLAGYEGMKRLESDLGNEGKQRLREDVRRLTQLYEGMDRPVQAAEWNRKLIELEGNEK